MNVEQLISIVKSLPDDYEGVGIDDVFSWRGSYDEPAFSIVEDTSKDDMLRVLSRCLEEEFCGYKGGDYFYYPYSPVNFDYDRETYSGGYYLKDWLNKTESSEFIHKVGYLLHLEQHPYEDY